MTEKTFEARIAEIRRKVERLKEERLAKAPLAPLSLSTDGAHPRPRYDPESVTETEILKSSSARRDLRIVASERTGIATVEELTESTVVAAVRFEGTAEVRHHSYPLAAFSPPPQLGARYLAKHYSSSDGPAYGLHHVHQEFVGSVVVIGIGAAVIGRVLYDGEVQPLDMSFPPEMFGSDAVVGAEYTLTTYHAGKEHISFVDPGSPPGWDEDHDDDEMLEWARSFEGPPRASDGGLR